MSFDEREEFLDSQPRGAKEGEPKLDLRPADSPTSAVGDLDLHPKESVEVEVITKVPASRPGGPPGLRAFYGAELPPRVRVRSADVVPRPWDWQVPEESRNDLPTLLQRERSELRKQRDDIQRELAQSRLKARRDFLRKTSALVLGGMLVGVVAGHFGVLSLFSAGPGWIRLLLAVSLMISAGGCSGLATVFLNDGPAALRRRWVQVTLVLTVAASIFVAWITV